MLNPLGDVETNAVPQRLLLHTLIRMNRASAARRMIYVSWTVTLESERRRKAHWNRRKTEANKQNNGIEENLLSSHNRLVQIILLFSTLALFFFPLRLSSVVSVVSAVYSFFSCFLFLVCNQQSEKQPLKQETYNQFCTCTRLKMHWLRVWKRWHSTHG